MAFGKNGAHMAEPQVPGVSAVGGVAVRAGVPVLEVNHVEKVYGSRNNVTRALADVSFAVNKGEFVGIMGASGSGKSTLLNCVSTIDTVTSGNVVINGADVTRMKHAKLTRFRREQLGFIFQDSNLLDTLTARENIALPLTIARVPAKETLARVEQVAQRLDIAGVLDKYPYQMSGGQQQRVALARALAVKPRVLLLDEPLSALDAKVRVQLRDQIRRIQLTTGTTTVFVTHDQEEALAVADRIGVMNKGKIEQIAAPQDLYQRPATEYVATFIGLTNRLPGASNGDEAVVFGQRVPLLAGSAKGDSVAVLVRPENLMLALAGSSDSHVGERARVEVIHFLGSLVRVDTVITSGEYQRWNKGEQLKATVQLPASELPAGLAVGDDVIVTPRPVAALAC